MKIILLNFKKNTASIVKPSITFRLLFIVLFLIGVATYANAGRKANSNAAITTTLTTFPAGVYIIDMGQTPQTVANGLKPYGLVYALIKAGIPVNWIIDPAKPKDGTDFFASSAGNPNKPYKGGSFIIDVIAYPGALAIINSWKTANPGLVVDGPTTATILNVPIFKILTIWPKAFLDAQNDDKITPYYANAGIPSSSYQINSDPTFLPQCGNSSGSQEVYILPHADPQDWDATWVTNLQNFIKSGGAMWAGCHAVSALENISGCNFLSSTGLVLWTGHDKLVNPPYIYTDSGNPIMQFVGKLDGATSQGSEVIYLPKSSWRPTTTVAVYDQNYINRQPNPDVSYKSLFPPATIVAYGPAYGSKGLVMYEAGHSFVNNGTIPEQVAAQRAFLNFLLLAGGQLQTNIVLTNISNQTTATCSGVAFTVTPSGTPANVEYTWSAPTGSGFTGGSAQTTGQSSISQVLTNTTINPVTAVYTVTPKIGGCIGNSFVTTVTVYPPTAMDVSSSSPTICSGNSTTLTASGATSYNWSPATGLSATTGAVVTASPSVTTTYTVTDLISNAYGCANSKSITVFVNSSNVTIGASPNPLCVGSTLNLTSSNVFASPTLLSEKFNGATNNWTTINNSTGGTPADATWTLRPDDYRIDCGGDNIRLSSNDNSQFYLSNSCDQGRGGTTRTILQSPVMNTMAYSTLSLNFYQYFRFYTGATATVEVSTDGSSWNTVATYTSTQGTATNFAQKIINLNAYIGNPTFYIRFKYDAPYSWYWAIDNVTVSGNVTNSPISWTGPNGFTSNIQNPTILNVTDVNAGDYTLTFNDPVSGCVSSTKTVTVSVNTPPTIILSASPPSICIGNSTTLNATGAVSYRWSPATGLSATAGDTVIASPLTTTTYTVTGTDANGCSSEETVEVVVNSLPVISITPASALICTSIGTQLEASGADTYSWSPVAGLSATTGPTVTASPSVATTYTVTGTSTSGCISTETVFVDVIPSPPTTGVTICQGGTGTLTSSAACPTGNSVTVGPMNGGNGNTTTAGAGTIAWVNPTNALLPSNYATADISGPGFQSSQYLRTTIYGFSIPGNATILGIKVAIRRKQDDQKRGNDVKDFEIKLLKSGLTVGSNYADTSTEWPTSGAIKNYGGTSDLWGATWTAAEINNANFGVSLQVDSDNDRTASVDYIQISVTYTIPGILNWYTVVSGGTPIGSGSPFNPVGVLNSGLLNTNTPGTYTFYAECSSDTRCRTATNFIITPNASITSVTGASPLCIGGTANYSAGAVVLGGGTGAWTSDNTAIATVNSSTGLVTAIASGTCNIIYTISSGCGGTKSAQQSLTVYIPAAPTISTITQPDCIIPTGTVLLTGLPLGGAINPGAVSYSGTTCTISGLAVGTHNFTVSNGSCTSLASANVVINAATTATWTGLAWINGPPNFTQVLEFAGNYNSSGDLTACSCIVNAGVTVDIKSGDTMTLTNEISVVATGSILFKDKSSLVQIANTQNNSGNIKYERNIYSSDLLDSDYIYWSSPVAGFTLGGVYINNTSGLFYSYGVVGGVEDWQPESSGTLMSHGKGYIINGKIYNFPNPPPPSPTFIGVPNNGPYTITGIIADKSYLLGNPYPSALDADTFLLANKDVLNGTLYFWTHNTPIAIGTPDPGTGLWAYSGDDYAAYNVTGGVGAAPPDIDPITGLPYPGQAPSAGTGGSNGNIPSGKIAAGQGFFGSSKVAPLSSTTIVYNNIMRVGGGGIAGNNSQFFKTKNPKTNKANSIEKHRIWLDLTNPQGAFKQTLVGYVTEATNDYDSRFDGESFDGNDFLDFYSVLQNNNLVIQGRALPFDENDEIPLGYRVAVGGAFSVSIDQTDGVLTNHPVFIEDKLTNTVFNLKSGKYTFATAAGTFNDRFVLRYTDKTLSTVETVDNDGITVLYSNNYKTLIIRNNVKDATVNAVSLFNMIGQNIANWDVKGREQTSIQIPIKNLPSEIYIVKVKTTKGESSKKIIIN